MSEDITKTESASRNYDNVSHGSRTHRSREHHHHHHSRINSEKRPLSRAAKRKRISSIVFTVLALFAILLMVFVIYIYSVE